MASEDRANDADLDDDCRDDHGDGLDDKASTFGESLLELDDDELAEQADEYLGFDGSWGEDGDSDDKRLDELLPRDDLDLEALLNTDDLELDIDELLPRDDLDLEALLNTDDLELDIDELLSRGDDADLLDEVGHGD